MIQNQEQFSIQSDSLSSAKFSLKQENLAHVFGILRSNLYSDKILAVIREYSTNAFDAHVAHNKPNLPIELTLPTVIEPTFQVRDFGKGLTEEDVFEIYSSYGASTKRNSNSYVGTLGMGSKAGFAYSPSFTITSYNGGMKKVYEAYIDETNIGTIAKVHEEATYEPTGICVKIDVRSADIRQFRDTAYNFFQYFEPLQYSLKH
jgi:DNA topoisomerase VI subunit B